MSRFFCGKKFTYFFADTALAFPYWGRGTARAVDEANAGFAYLMLSRHGGTPMLTPMKNIKRAIDDRPYFASCARLTLHII